MQFSTIYCTEQNQKWLSKPENINVDLFRSAKVSVRIGKIADPPYSSCVSFQTLRILFRPHPLPFQCSLLLEAGPIFRLQHSFSIFLLREDFDSSAGRKWVHLWPGPEEVVSSLALQKSVHSLPGSQSFLRPEVSPSSASKSYLPPTGSQSFLRPRSRKEVASSLVLQKSVLPPKYSFRSAMPILTYVR